MRAKIAMIIPYFGEWPEWIDLFLYSCSKNPQVDFWFFTDCRLPATIYRNTIFRMTSFEAYCERVSRVLDIDFHPASPYKLCDLKAFYGVVHADDLTGYDYWAFGDNDLIWGNLDIIINPRNLKKYDLITAHSYHIAGHFTVIRKESKYTRLCLKVPDWKTLLLDTKNYALDEGLWSNMVYPELKQVRRLYRFLFKPIFRMHFFRYLALMNPLFCNRFTHRSFVEYYTSPNPALGQQWEYRLNENKIFRYDGLELPYLHFLFFKRNIYSDSEYYWKPDFYQLPTDWKKEVKRSIYVSVEGIILKDINSN